MDSPPQHTGTTPQHARFWDGELLFGVLFALLLCFHLGMNLWWLGADNHTIRVDEEVHMENTRNYYQALFVNEYDNLFQRAIAVTNIKPSYPVHPPLLHILGALVLAIFGYSVDTMALTNTFMFLAMLVGIFLIARSFMEQWSALYCVFVASFTPAIYSCSRYMMTDYLAATLVVWAIYALLQSDRFRKTEWVFLFAIINGLAILTRTVAFLYFLLPCAIVVLAGAWLLLVKSNKERNDGFTWTKLFLHCAMTLVVTVGVFGPWYFHNLEHYYNYWMEQRSGVVRQILPTENVPAPEAQAVAAPTQDAASPGETSAPKASPAPPKKSPSLWERLIRPRVEWSRYLLLVINNSVFLPLFVLSICGVILGLAHRRFRSFSTLLILAWVLGSYFFMTQLFHFANPRYALAVTPALAIFASLCVLAPSKPSTRFALCAVLASLLLFTYGNLVVKEYGKYARLEIPSPIQSEVFEQFDDGGLVVFKSELPQSYSFSEVGPPTQTNYKDFYFNAMLREEAKQEALRGAYANYQKLNSRGMEFDEQHYWPDSPFLRRDIPAVLIPQRKLKFIGGGSEPTHLLQYLDNTDYVVYTIDVGKEAEELRWQQYFAERGFRLVDRLRMERFGAMAARYHGIMAHAQVGQAIQLATPEDVETLDIFDLHLVMESEKFKALSPTLQSVVQERFNTLVNSPPFGVDFPLCPEASIMGVTARRSEGNAYEFRMVFKSKVAFARDLGMYLRVKPDAAYLGALSPEEAGIGHKEWRFEPLPATTTWKVGAYTVVSHQIQLPPGVYWISFGFYSDALGFHGQSANLGWMNLGVEAQE